MTSIVLAARESPSASAVQAALARILASEPFRASPQLGAFLRFVVEAALAGRAASLKGYTIAIEALGRDPRFNPQVDPIVRVEATRLRRAVARYYATEGRDDPIRIELPRGTYVPTFTHRDAEREQAAAPLQPDRTTSVAPPRPARAVLAVAIVCALAALVAVGSRLLAAHDERALTPAPSQGSGDTSAKALPFGNGMPTIAIDDVRVSGTPPRGHAPAGSLGEKIRDAFARFDTINVAYEPPRETAARSGPRPDYRLIGTLDYDEATPTLRFQLVDTDEGTIAWTRTFAYPGATVEQIAAEDGIVVALTNTLLQSYGVIRARDRAKQLASSSSDPRYRCVLEAADALRSHERAIHERARACLIALTTGDPSFALGFEFLSILEVREDTIAGSARAGEPPALDRALRAARRAVELAPASGRAYLDLFVVLYARHEVAAAFAAGDKAIALNKYDMLTLAEYGGRLIMTGEVERGMAMLQRAADNGGGIPPSWHHFYLFLGNYLAGDMPRALFDAQQITADNYPLGFVARAVAEIRNGRPEDARRAIDHLLEIQPAWRNEARRLLEKSIYRREAVDRLMHDLAAAGLPSSS